jgi:hypothetical protein
VGNRWEGWVGNRCLAARGEWVGGVCGGVGGYRIPVRLAGEEIDPSRPHAAAAAFAAAASASAGGAPLSEPAAPRDGLSSSGRGRARVGRGAQRRRGGARAGAWSGAAPEPMRAGRRQELWRWDAETESLDCA